MNKPDMKDMTPSQLITNQIEELADWRGEVLARLRLLIHEAAPGITEEWKWGTPVYSQKGMVCASGVFKDHVKINFFNGASLEDPQGLFNAGLDAKASRGIDITKGEEVNAPALKDLIRNAVAYNASGAKSK